ncbi:MAG: RNA polymerase sigma factor [Acidobacteria bacterium]|nr:RNA polymerase sigma factor [Acidobacteriota bacterium]
MDEALWIRRAREGDLDAFEAIVRGKRERVFWTAYRIVGAEEAAKDVAQTVFVRLWQNLGRIDPDRPLDPWLHRTTVNLAIDAFRRSRRFLPLTGDLEDRPAAARSAAADPPDAALARAEVQSIFDRLARHLTAAQRAAFVLVEIEGYRADEAARTLGVRPSTVRNHLLNARRLLRRRLLQLYPEYAGGFRRRPEREEP